MQQFVNQIRYSVRAERRGEPACSLLTNYDTVTPSLLVMPGQGEDTREMDAKKLVDAWKID